MSVESLQIKITAINEAGKVLNQVKQQIDSLKKTEARFNALGKNLSDIGKRATVGMTAPIVGGLVAAARQAISFESAMNEVNKALNLDGLGGKKFEAMADRIKALSAETGQMPVQVAQGMTELGKLGVADIGNQLETMSKLVSAVGTNFEMTASEAGNAVGKLTNVYGYMDKAGKVNVAGLQKLTDTIDYLGDVGLTSGRDITNVLGRIGGPAKNFGLAAEEAAAFGAAMLNTGTAPEVVATAINGILPKLQAATRQTGKFKKGLTEMGLSAEGLEQSIKKDAAGALQDFFVKLNKVEDKTGLIQQMFGAGSDSALIAQFANDTGLMTKAFNDITKVKAGRAMDSFNQNMETTAGQMQKLQASMALIGVEIGAALLPPLNDVMQAMIPLVQSFAKFARENPKIVQAGIAFAGLAATLGPVLFIAGQLVSTFGALYGVLANIQRIRLAGTLANMLGGKGAAAKGFLAGGAGKAAAGAGILGAAGLGAMFAGFKGAAMATGQGDQVDPETFGKVISYSLKEAFVGVDGQASTISQIPAAIGVLGNAVKSQFIADVAQMKIELRILGTQAKQSFTSMVNSVGQGVGPVITSIKTAFAGLGQSFAPMMAGVQAAFGNLGPTIAMFAAQIGPTLSMVGMQAQMAFQGLMMGAQQAGMALQQVGMAAMAAGQALASAIASGVASAVAAVQGMGAQMLGTINGLAGSMFSAGAALIQNLISGIQSMMGAAMAAVSQIGSAIRSALPGSEPKWAGSPLRNLSAAGSAIISNTAAGITPGPLMSAMGGALTPIASMLGGAGVTPPTGGTPITPAATAGGFGGSVSVSVVVNAGTGEAQGIADTLEERLETLMPRLMNRYESNKARVAYG